MDSYTSSPQSHSSFDSLPGSSRCTTPDSTRLAPNLIPNSPIVCSVKNICCVGAGYVGGPTAAVIAFQNPNIHVSVVDNNPIRIQQWNSKHLPVEEPGLERIVRISRDGTKSTTSPIGYFNAPVVIPSRRPNLLFSTEVDSHIAAADIVFIAVNTPTKASGIGAGAAANLSAFESAVKTVARLAKSGAIIVEKSTVPCGTADTIREILSLYRPNEDFEVLSNPEFLAEGTAINDLLYPDRILIGSSQTTSGLVAASVLRSVYTTWVDPSKVLTVNLWSSELAKLVANAMLAQRISSINAVSAICDQTGADVDEVALAIGLDARLGSKFLKAGLGFGGSCFKKDILSLSYLANLLHLPEVAEYWMAVLTVNEFQRNRFMQKVVTRLNGALVGKKITVLGYTFKQDTNDTRESPAIDVIKALLSERPAEIAIFDPGCTLQGIRNNIDSLATTVDPHVLKPHGPVEAYSNAYEACADSSAVLILTPWKQFHYPQSKKVVDPFIPNKTDLAPMFVMSKPVLSEMDIFSLEAHLKDTTARPDLKGLENELDRLERFVDQPPCPSDCQPCHDSLEPLAVHAHENIDWSKVASSMSHPKWVFDGRNIVDSKGMAKLGFRIENLGKGGKRYMN